MHILEKIKNTIGVIESINDRLQKVQQALGRIESRQSCSQGNQKFNEYEFQVYSQWGEDGLIQYIVNKIAIDRPIFVEFGVEKYTESNTRFLLINNNWSGLIIDGSQKNIDYVKNDTIYWKFNLKAEYAFIDKDNINDLIQKNGISGDIGLLSVDIDGNDYWVWDAINIINPRIVICEYNSLWGADLAVSTPYNADFFRTKSHFTNLYYGASISALTQLASTKGYSLVGSNKAGNNVFFVRNDLFSDFKRVTPEEVWVQSQFREARDESGQLTYLSFNERLSQLADMPLISLTDGKQYKISELYDQL